MNFGFDKVVSIKAKVFKSQSKGSKNNTRTSKPSVDKAPFAIYEDNIEQDNTSMDSTSTLKRQPLIPLTKEQIKLRSVRLTKSSSPEKRPKSPSPRTSICMNKTEEPQEITKKKAKHESNKSCIVDFSNIDEYKLEIQR